MFKKQVEQGIRSPRLPSGLGCTGQSANARHVANCGLKPFFSYPNENSCKCSIIIWNGYSLEQKSGLHSFSHSSHRTALTWLYAGRHWRDTEEPKQQGLYPHGAQSPGRETSNTNTLPKVIHKNSKTSEWYSYRTHSYPTEDPVEPADEHW